MLQEKQEQRRKNWLWWYCKRHRTGGGGSASACRGWTCKPYFWFKAVEWEHWKATTTWINAPFNWSLLSVSIIRFRLSWTMPSALSTVSLTSSTPILTMFWSKPPPSCRFQSESHMPTGRRFRPCSTTNTTGWILKCRSISVRSMKFSTMNANVVFLLVLLRPWYGHFRLGYLPFARCSLPQDEVI